MSNAQVFFSLAGVVTVLVAWVRADIHKRFDDWDKHFAERHFADQIAFMNRRFDDQSAFMNQRFADLHKRIDTISRPRRSRPHSPAAGKPARWGQM